jgi:hypothetical protein
VRFTESMNLKYFFESVLWYAVFYFFRLNLLLVIYLRIGYLFEKLIFLWLKFFRLRVITDRF